MGYIGSEVALHESAWVHESAHLYGRITIGAEASVWINAVMRSEINEIIIGARSNVQDFVMIHVGYETPTLVGENCSIAHHATLHGCEVGDNCLIGINATVMDGACIGANSIVAGQAIVTEGRTFPPSSIIAGAPAKVVATRDMSVANIANADFYRQNAKNYALGIERFDATTLARLMGAAND